MKSTRVNFKSVKASLFVTTTGPGVLEFTAMPGYKKSQPL